MKTIKLFMTLLALTVATLTMNAQSPIAVDWHMGQNNTAAGNYNSQNIINNNNKQPQSKHIQKKKNHKTTN